MKKTKTSKKTSPKKTKANASKKVAAKSKLVAKKKAAPKSKLTAKSKAVARKATKAAPVVKAKVGPKKKARRVGPATVEVGSQDVETVTLKPKARVARAGAGGGDFGGASLVEDADSESVDELLEEGQAFEAGIVRGVEAADDEIENEAQTHEVPQDDVPGEYEGEDQP
jgi:hypothetical protein